MPVNRNALIRYKTIDNCLRNRYRPWTLEDLIEACSEALYEYEGIDKGVSRRTVQMDIQLMRSEKLGYCAPIVVVDRKYYTYEDPAYSITNIPITQQDLDRLSEVTEILRQFKGFSHFQELSGMVQKLEDKVHTSKTNERSIIDLEKNDNLRGLEYIDPIFQTIVKKRCVKITYQSFKARSADTFLFHPALLKEYRNRWFVLGKKKEKAPFLFLALDRIQDVSMTEELAMVFDDDKLNGFFKDVIGVSVNDGEPPVEVRLFVNHLHAPYVVTKPLHHSQKVISTSDQGIEVSLQVQHNFELEREILGFGDGMRVLSPPRLRAKIKERMNHAIDIYNTELSDERIKGFGGRLEAKGYVILNHVYTRKAIAKMGSLLYKFKKEHAPNHSADVYTIRSVLEKIPALKEWLFNVNLKKILAALGEGWFLTKALYFDKPPKSNWYVIWHQDTTINVREKQVIDGYYGWTKKENAYGVCPPEEILKETVAVRIHLDDTTSENGALSVLPGSHNQRFSEEELRLLTSSALPAVCEVMAGGIQIMKPLLVHSSTKTTNMKNRRVIHLEFGNMNLPEGLSWAEKVDF